MIPERKAVSHTEFARKVNENGGASRRLSDLSEGPSSGFYVSRHPDRSVRDGGSEETNISRAVSAKDVTDHLVTVGAALRGSQNRDEVYQGGWHDKKAGASALDVSDRHVHFNTAIRAGRENNQRAIYDANRGEDVNVHKTPGASVASPTDFVTRYGVGNTRVAG